MIKGRAVGDSRGVMYRRGMGERTQAGRSARNAYATLVTNEEYGRGALALVRSLRWTGTEAPLVVLATGEAEHLDELENEGCRIVPVRQPSLSDDFRLRHSREALHRAAPFNKGNKPAFHDPVDNFCKLELWKLTEYDRIVFLDADSLVVKPIDMLFGFPEFAGAPNLYETLADFHRLNSGVFVAEPSLVTYERLLERVDRPGVFWRRTDQTFLEAYFPDWHKLPYTFNTMQYVYFNLPELWVWKSIRLVHYQYEKPWSEENPKRHLLGPVIDLWWRMFEGKAPPDDLPVMPSSKERSRDLIA
jgi:alpha-N-acetylglucosamine transferase